VSTEIAETLLDCPVALAERYDLALLDLDGVVYIGRDPVPGAAEALESARGAGIRLCYVTNNASRPPQVVAEHLRSLGVPASDEEVVTSAQAAAALLAERLPAGAAVLVVGGEGLNQALLAEGLTPVSSVRDAPRAVVQGFSPDIGWRLLAEGARAVHEGLPWLATNTDRTVPTRYGPAPGNGTLVAAIATATGVEPEVAGKPEPPLFLQAAHRYGSTAPLVVGDRLDTDIAGAHAAAMPGLLVLTGVSGARDALGASPSQRPHYLGTDLHALVQPHRAPRPEPPENGNDQARRSSAWRCGAAVATVRDGGLHTLEAGPDPLDLLRAGCAAAWERADAAQARDGSGDLDVAGFLGGLARLDGALPWAR